MSTARMAAKLALLPKYCARASAVTAGTTCFMGTEVYGAFDKRWGSQGSYSVGDRIKNAGVSLVVAAPIGYGAGFLAGKGIAKTCELAAKSGIPQAAMESAKRFIKKL